MVSGIEPGEQDRAGIFGRRVNVCETVDGSAEEESPVRALLTGGAAIVRMAINALGVEGSRNSERCKRKRSNDDDEAIFLLYIPVNVFGEFGNKFTGLVRTNGFEKDDHGFKGDSFGDVFGVTAGR
jgi:hypothetical protein